MLNMNNEIAAAIAGAIEAFESSNNFVITAIKRQINIVDVGSRNPWAKAESKKSVCVL